ncbi:hypothetical protein WDU94_002689 [Cyamophila willieti]
MDGTRLFVGNLPVNTTESDVRTKFSRYGQVLKVELKERKFLQPPSCFGFITLDAPRHALQNCISELSDYNAWNGHPVTVDFAKESFLSRLEKERLDPKNKNIIVETTPVSSTTTKKIPSTPTNAKNSQTKFVSKQNEEESEGSETETTTMTSDDEADDAKNVSSHKMTSTPKTSTTIATNPAKKNVNCVQVRSNPKNTSKIDSESSDTDDSSSDETDDKNANASTTKKSPTNTASSVIKTNHLVRNVMNTNSSQNKQLVQKCESLNSSDSESEDDYRENVNNIKNIVNHSNDVMKSFEQFSSVWQDSDSEGYNEPNDSSDDSIFEAFKTVDKNPETGSADKTISFDDMSTCDNGTKPSNEKTLNRKSSFPSENKQFPARHMAGELNNDNSTGKKGSNIEQRTFSAFNTSELNNNSTGKTRTFPAFNGKRSDDSVETKCSGFPAFKSTISNKSAEKNSNSCERDFVKFGEKTQSPHGSGNQAFSEATISKFPKCDSKNRKIVFDEGSMTCVRVSSVTQSVQNYNKWDSNNQFTPSETIAKNVKKSNVDAEMKRRNAVDERRKDILEKKNAIRQALANVDSQHSTGSSGGVNKKIIFSQDSDDDQSNHPVMKTIKPRDQNKSNPFSNTDTNETSRPFSTSGEKSLSEDGIQANKRKSLFDDESSENGSESEDGMMEEGEFKIKKQFEGEKGLKLLELQASYNNDARFNLDDRFMEEEEEGEKEDKEEKRRKEEEGEGDERERQMQILENVLGYKVKQHQTKNGLLQIPRFDPLNPDHKTLFVPPKPKRDKTSRDRKKRRRDNPVEVSEEKFYQVDEEYFTSNQQKEKAEEEPFSLLRMLNRDTVSDEDAPVSTSTATHNNLANKQGEYRTEPLSKSSNPFSSVGARFEYDSSDSDDEEEEDHDGSMGVKGHTNHSEDKTEGATSDELKAQHGSRQGQFGTGLLEPPPMQGAGTSEKMFFGGQNDDRLKEAQEFWKQKPTSFFPSSGVDAFKLKRRELALKLKTKVRRNAKNSMNMKKNTVGAGAGGKRKKTTKMMKTQRRK